MSRLAGAVRWAGRAAAAVVGGALALGAANRALADRAAAQWFDDDERRVLGVADALARAMRDGTSPDQYHTGSDRFDGEWALVTCQMTVLSLGRLLERHPDREAAWRPAIASCARWLASPASRRFGTAAWGVDALEDPDPDHGHAYVGYTNSALAVAARTGDTEAAAVSERLSRRLLASFAARPAASVETYPGEAYPPDLAVALGSLGLAGHADALGPALAQFRADAVDPRTGLLHMWGPDGQARGSGTMLAVFFLGFVDPALADDLARAAQRSLRGRWLGYGGVLEAFPGDPPAADIDSGPVLFGMSVSASGFGLAATRRLGDAAWHREIVRSAYAVGLPLPGGWYAAGGCLGNAILLAMETAPRGPEVPPPTK